VTITPPYEEIDYSDLLNRVATSEVREREREREKDRASEREADRDGKRSTERKTYTAL